MPILLSRGSNSDVGQVGGEVWAAHPTGDPVIDHPMLDAAIAALPVGGVLRLHDGGDTPYAIAGPWVIRKSCTVKGCGARGRWLPGTSELNQSIDGPAVFPYVAGSVILQTTAGVDGVSRPESTTTVNLQDFGVRFDESFKFVNTGHAFNSQPDTTYGTGLMPGQIHSVDRNLWAYGHDGNHYGFRRVNGILCQLGGIFRSFGGGVLQLAGISESYNYGNEVIENAYGQMIVGGSAHGYSIYNNRGAAVGLLNFGRIQCNGGVSSKYPTARRITAFQSIRTTDAPTGGTFTLTYKGQTTSALVYNASAATVQTALEAVSNVGAGNVTATGGPLPATIKVTFADALPSVAMMTAAASLTGGLGIPRLVVETQQYLFNALDGPDGVDVGTGSTISIDTTVDFESALVMPIRFGGSIRSHITPGGILGNTADVDSRAFAVATALDTGAYLGSDMTIRGKRTPNPVIVAGSGAGTGPTLAIVGDDYSGYFTITFGTGSVNTLSSILATVTLDKTRGTHIRAWNVDQQYVSGLARIDPYADVNGAANTVTIRASGTGTIVEGTQYKFGYVAADSI